MFLCEELNSNPLGEKSQALLLTFTTMSKRIMSVLLLLRATQIEAVLYKISTVRWAL